MTRIALDEGWHMRAAPLHWGAEMAAAVAAAADGWYDCSLPCDVHVPLIAAGVIPEPLEADNARACLWIEDRSWWFRRTFAIGGAADSSTAELVLEAIDAESDVLLNGIHLGHHRSAFHPFRRDVKALLKPGENLLMVRATSGIERYDDAAVSRLRETVSVEPALARGDKRRVFVRKPQYVYGWDWGPRLATCGITGRAWLELHAGVAIRGASMHTVSVSVDGGSARLAFAVEAENLHAFATVEASIAVRVSSEHGEETEIEQRVLLRSGINIVKGELDLASPRLWWPNGMGGQPLYTIRVSCVSDSGSDEWPVFRFGVRTLRLNTDPVGTRERLFRFEVNDVPVFCKGGNWIPADSLYARVSDRKYETLIAKAQEANFTMLRVWGGGLYERERFYESCDERGILVWQDMMFACALYPDDEQWFRREVEQELDYQTRRLRNHASLALWCGNNENHWGMDEWWTGARKPPFLGGAWCWNILAPRTVEANCGWIPYWNSSPYGGEHPNGNEVGDRHHWYDCMMNPDMEKRIAPEEYDRVGAKFVSEYGYIGPCPRPSMERYFAGQPLDQGSAVWKLHTNTFEKDTVAAGIARHYCDPLGLDLDGYLLYAGLCQGLMLGYSLEALRFIEGCWGGLFWMYDDCWGEVGWTIIDYYLRTKPSWNFVKRALAPRKLIARRHGSLVRVRGINETSEKLTLSVEHGYLSFDGRVRETQTLRVELPPFSREIVLETPASRWDMARGCFCAGVVGESFGFLPAQLRAGCFRQLSLPEPVCAASDVVRSDGGARFTVRAQTFAHAVHFGLGDAITASDEYFDLLPGEERCIELSGDLSVLEGRRIAPKAVTGNWERDR